VHEHARSECLFLRVVLGIVPIMPCGTRSSPGKFECIGRRRSTWCTRAELSQRADSEPPSSFPPMQTIYYIGLDAHKRTISYCVKDASGAMHAAGTLPATHLDLDHWMKTRPQPWTVRDLWPQTCPTSQTFRIAFSYLSCPQPLPAGSPLVHSNVYHNVIY
jgi:hypothetical protein